MKIAVFLILILNLTNAHDSSDQFPGKNSTITVTIDGVSYQIPKLKPLDKCTLQAYINTALSILKAEEDYRNCSESERATRGQCVADQSYSLLKIIAFELGCEFKTLLKLLTEDYDQLLENKSVGDIVGDVMRCLEGLSARPQILFKDQLVTTNNHVEGLSAVPQILFKDQLVTTNNHVLLVKNMISHSFIHDTLEDERKILSALLFGSKSQFQEFLSILKNVGNA
ncbi:uncharacterized protein LOC134934755 isoform X2 [Pseudophryne corroboree]|uniref:uncharacterized protein LOC134934755 isoform X2 n=1 Tax=Pseudophryne corroboree TaxID=495146 RepID=UPI0030813B10